MTCVSTWCTSAPAAARKRFPRLPGRPGWAPGPSVLRRVGVGLFAGFRQQMWSSLALWVLEGHPRRPRQRLCLYPDSPDVSWCQVPPGTSLTPVTSRPQAAPCRQHLILLLWTVWGSALILLLSILSSGLFQAVPPPPTPPPAAHRVGVVHRPCSLLPSPPSSLSSCFFNSFVCSFNVVPITFIFVLKKFFFFLLCCMAFGILVPWLEIEPVPLPWKWEVSSTGPWGKSLFL